MNSKKLTLNDHDPAVIAARLAETGLFKHYGLVPKENYLSIPNSHLKMRILEIGTGEPVLVVPGNTGDVFPLAALLAEMKGRRIIAINRPGGGLSEGMDHTEVDIRRFAAQCILTVMDAYRLDKADIVAHSMGAHWSLLTAMDYPGRVRSLTLIGNPGNVMKGKPPIMLKLLMAWPFNKLFFKILKGPEGDTKPKMLKTMGSSKETIKRLPKELGEAYYYFKRLPHYFTSLTSLLKNAPPTIEALDLSTITQPTQLLLGDKDTFASVNTGHEIVHAIPDATLHVIKGGSHLPWLEQPGECGKLVNDFLSK